MRQIPLPIGPDPLHTFDGFVAGANGAALAHLRAMAASLQAPSAIPVYLWGVRGSGKTHLLRALADATRARGLRAGCFDAACIAPWPFDEGWSLLLLDGCEALDATQQQAAFALFIEAATHGVPIVAAGALPPVDLPLRDDLRTRLGWGHVFAIRPLAEPEVRATLRRVADQREIGRAHV